MIPRTLEQNIINDLKLKKAIILLGARQVGKTTLLKNILKNDQNTLIINGDEPDSNEQLVNLTSSRLKALLGNAQTLLLMKLN